MGGVGGGKRKKKMMQLCYNLKKKNTYNLKSTDSQVRPCPIRSFIGFERKNIIHESCQSSKIYSWEIITEGLCHWGGKIGLSSKYKHKWKLRAEESGRCQRNNGKEIWTKQMEQGSSKAHWSDGVISYGTVEAEGPDQI